MNEMSYPSQLERIFEPIFEKLSFTLEVRNAGLNGMCGDDWHHRHSTLFLLKTTSLLFSGCLNHLVGDADVIHGVMQICDVNL